MTLTPGTHLGPYKILSLIGVGGMGEVYKGHDTRPLDRIVAVKVLPPHLADRVELRERFDREARAVAALKDRKSTRLNSSHIQKSRMPSSA